MNIKNPIKKTEKNNIKGYLYIFPAGICLLLFVILPLFQNLYLSFFSWNMVTSKPKFIGLRNYTDLIDSEEFYISLSNSFQYALIIIPAVLVLGFVLASLISRPSKINVIYRTIFFIPRVTSMVAMSAVWLFLYNPQYGAINNVLGLFGITPVRWLNETATALFSLSVIVIWRTIGYTTVIYLSGIQNIPVEVIEAGRLDGVTGLKRIWYIDLPLVSPTSFMLLILTTIDTLKLFTSIEVMTGGGPANSTQNLVVLLYNYAFKKYAIGYASAVSFVLFLLILAINLFQMKLEKKVVYD